MAGIPENRCAEQRAWQHCGSTDWHTLATSYSGIDCLLSPFIWADWSVSCAHGRTKFQEFTEKHKFQENMRTFLGVLGFRSMLLTLMFVSAGGAGIRIIFEKTTIRPKGSLSQLPPFDTPPIPNFLRQSSPNQNSGDFVTTYLDPEFRISRGDRGELRIFVRAWKGVSNVVSAASLRIPEVNGLF